jgi:hypothetical protein
MSMISFPPPKVKKILEYDYVGDGTVDRKIDLGDDYDVIYLWRNGNIGIEDLALGGFCKFLQIQPLTAILWEN